MLFGKEVPESKQNAGHSARHPQVPLDNNVVVEDTTRGRRFSQEKQTIDAFFPPKHAEKKTNFTASLTTILMETRCNQDRYTYE
jgi:hypothetical protein